MKNFLVLFAVVGCCLALPKRQAKSYQSASDRVHDVGKESVVQISPVVDHHTPVSHDPVQVVHHDTVVPVVPQGRSVEFHDEQVPVYPQFGVKVDQVPRSRKVVRSRARAILSQGYNNHQYNYVPEVRYDQVASSKALVAPYQQKPLYQVNRDQYQPNYQESYNKYYSQQQRTDDVPQPPAGYAPGPIHPGALPPAPVSDNKVEATPKPIAILAMNQDVNYDGTFVYDFEAENGIKSAVSGSTKRVEGFEKPVQVMSGSYSYFTPEGNPVETRWYADETGFHAEGDHLPVAPPVPEAIQRAVEYLKTLPPQEDEVAAQPVPAYPNAENYPQRFDQQQNYQPQQSYPSQQNYQPQQSYPSQQNYQPQQSYPQQNYPTQTNFDKYPSPQLQPYPAKQF